MGLPGLEPPHPVVLGLWVLMWVRAVLYCPRKLAYCPRKLTLRVFFSVFFAGFALGSASFELFVSSELAVLSSVELAGCCKKSEIPGCSAPPLLAARSFYRILCPYRIFSTLTHVCGRYYDLVSDKDLIDTQERPSRRMAEGRRNGGRMLMIAATFYSDVACANKRE